LRIAKISPKFTEAAISEWTFWSYEKSEGSDSSILWLYCRRKLAVKYLLILKTAY